ncbi:PREDICTED: uncharacterized protein LOC107169043 [Diuraphis noxia]|uniref:uncharacterized protein LOC107169043 n=1 Tax=Diuraphis noxia TaxID=143948 RepID=UPI000763A746|nr:PREDICTED: uncharacterized protein LOC107169043 [Diuraphis noxia]
MSAVGCVLHDSLASAVPTSYKFGYSANDLGTVELDAPALGLIKDCDPLTSSYMVTGSTAAPAVMRSAVEIEPASIMSITPSPILSTVSVSSPAPILRTAIDIEPARIINAAPMKLETRIATSPLLSAFRPALATFDSNAWQASVQENASPAPMALRTITKTAKVTGSTIISSGLDAMPAVHTQYTSVTAAPQVESKIVQSAPIATTLSTGVLPLPTVSTSYSYVPQTYASSYLKSYTAPQYYSTVSKFLAAPQYYPSAASFAPQYYSSAASFAPQYYSSAASFAPQYYSSASVAADEPCDK